MSIHSTDQHVVIELPRRVLVLIVIVSLLLLLSPFVATAVGLYATTWRPSFVERIARTLPYPAALISGKRFMYEDYLIESSAMKKILASENQPTDKVKIDEVIKGRKSYESALENLRRDRHLSITDEQEQVAKDMISEGDMDKLYKTLENDYGYPRSYIDLHVVRIAALMQSISEDLAREKAEVVRERIMKGEDFGTVAKEMSDDKASGAKGGELGAFGKGAMVPEFEAAAFSMKSGELSEPIKTKYGWHIIRVESVEGEGDTKKVTAKHILLMPHWEEVNTLALERAKGIEFKWLIKK